MALTTIKINKTVLVTGGKGMVGSQVEFGIRLSHSELDVLNPETIYGAVELYKPDAIFHLAALDLITSENSLDRAYEVNVIGTFNIARVCREKNIKLVYLSSCAVFDGKKKTPYKETDWPAPLNVYGKTKWLSELMATGLVPNALIVRTGWLFGGGLKIDKRFVKLSFIKFQKGLEVKATANRHGSPTYIPDLLQTIKKLIEKDASGIFHIVNNHTASYFEIAKAIRKFGKFNMPVIPVKASEVEPAGLKRGRMEALSSTKIKMRSYKEALKEYVGILNSG